MTSENLPSIDGLGFDRLMELREQIDARLESIKSEFISQAQLMGLACSADGVKKRKRRNAHKDAD